MSTNKFAKCGVVCEVTDDDCELTIHRPKRFRFRFMRKDKQIGHIFSDENYGLTLTMEETNALPDDDPAKKLVNALIEFIDDEENELVFCFSTNEVEE